MAWFKHCFAVILNKETEAYMQYRFKVTTQNERRGQVYDLNPLAVRTKQLLDRGLIEAVEPPAEKRETKVVEPTETKKPRKRRKKVNHDESVSKPDSRTSEDN